VLTCRPAENLAIATFVISIGDPSRRVLKQSREPRLVLAKRQARKVFAVELLTYSPSTSSNRPRISPYLARF
jgi:hypothetical protein